MTMPLLIGGATTSRQHTAVKIAPEFSGATVHVLDASRAVDVVSSLLSDRQRDAFIATTSRAEQAELREQYASRREQRAADARGRARQPPRRPTGTRSRSPVPVVRRHAASSSRPLEELVPFIDWTFFFSAWELKGRFPAILDHPDVRRGRRASCTTTRRHCSSASSTRSCSRRAASTASGRPTPIGDDIVVYKDDARKAELARFHMLRQQEPIADGRPNRSLADFVAPQASRSRRTTSARSR